MSALGESGLRFLLTREFRARLAGIATVTPDADSRAQQLPFHDRVQEDTTVMVEALCEASAAASSNSPVVDVGLDLRTADDARDLAGNLLDRRL
jgi:hypothetical protein